MSWLENQGLVRVRVPLRHGCTGCHFQGETCTSRAPLSTKKCNSAHYNDIHEAILVTEDQALLIRLRHGYERL